jgi:hypothetical protein
LVKIPSIALDLLFNVRKAGVISTCEQGALLRRPWRSRAANPDDIEIASCRRDVSTDVSAIVHLRDQKLRFAGGPRSADAVGIWSRDGALAPAGAAGKGVVLAKFGSNRTIAPMRR